jgi:hypothetical protein
MSSFDYILKLKALFNYNYIQDICFPSQQAGQKICSRCPSMELRLDLI